MLHDVEFRSLWDGHRQSIVCIQTLALISLTFVSFAQLFWLLSNQSYFTRSYHFPNTLLALSIVKFWLPTLSRNSNLTIITFNVLYMHPSSFVLVMPLTRMIDYSSEYQS